MMQKALKSILVVTGDPSLADPTKPGQRFNPEDLEVARQLGEALATLDGYDVAFLDRHDELVERMIAERPDLVLNFCDTGFRNLASRELHVPALLELLDIPYTGAPPAAMAICFDKQIVRLIALSMGVPVPRESFVAAGDEAPDLVGLLPALIKPNQGDGSLGITMHSVVGTVEEAAAYLAWLRRELPGRDILVQEYLPGAEYGVGLIGNSGRDLEALPILEVDYGCLPDGLPPILGYESKSHPDSPYWTEIRYVRARLDPARRDLMTEASVRLFRRLGLQDYGRFDFRCGADGVPRLMEVNPNPAWGYDAKLAMMAGLAGMTYPALLERIIRAALARTGGS